MIEIPASLRPDPLVWRSDRLARSTKHLLLALEEFRSLGVQFVNYQENIDTRRRQRQALFTIASEVARLDRHLIRERVSVGVQKCAACGRELGPPRRVVDQDRLARMKAEGASLRQIAEVLGVGYETVRAQLQKVS